MSNDNMDLQAAWAKHRMEEQQRVQRELDEQCVGSGLGSEKSGANAVQHGGSHYKQFKFETWDVINDWALGYFDGNAVKYLSRWRHKGGLEDLRKARHYIDKLIELETNQ